MNPKLVAEFPMQPTKITSTIVVALAVVLMSAPNLSAADKERVLHTFKGTDGGAPDAGVIFDDAGNLYGTVQGGSGNHLFGAVFELLPDGNGKWTEKVLHTFNGKDGWQPIGGLIRDTTGNLYGTTSLGGTRGDGGDGTVFELTPRANGKWTEKVLHNFGGADGYYPMTNLIFDTTGNLYGTTQTGGTSTACPNGCGVVFELSPAAHGQWTEKVLHDFGKGEDGRNPYGLIFDATGNLYGTTYFGGAKNSGTVFELLPGNNGKWTEKVLHSFGLGTDGSNPQASLIFDASGNLYGTTLNGGIHGYGAVIELMPQTNGQWTDKVLHSFNNDGKDGRYPQGVLIFDGTGNLYGTTPYGGSGTGCTAQFGLCGTVFELMPEANGKWTEKVLHSFVGNGSDGVGPYAGLIFDPAGNLYSTTFAGGAGLGLYGTVFEIIP
jgi:uncharacterized repeat protein (TIGR03803 family)